MSGYATAQWSFSGEFFVCAKKCNWAWPPLRPHVLEVFFFDNKGIVIVKTLCSSIMFHVLHCFLW